MKPISGAACALLILAAAGSASAQSQGAAERGHQIFDKWCYGCHAPNPAKQRPGGGLVGQVFAGTYTLQQRYQGAKPAALEQRTDLTGDYIRYVVRNGLNVMPRTRKTEIPDSDLDAVVAYLTRNNP